MQEANEEAKPAEPSTPQSEVYAAAESRVSAAKVELNEMRVIGSRLDPLPLESRRRVLHWLSEHYTQPPAPPPQPA